jgi:hypothetical protein
MARVWKIAWFNLAFLPLKTEILPSVRLRLGTLQSYPSAQKIGVE